MKVKVLRLGHRRERDKRISTHVGLVARAFGAEEIILSGEHDKNLMSSLEDVAKRWGGPFEISYEKNWKEKIKKMKKEGWKVVHLTMYGEKLEKKIKEIRKLEKIIVIVGGEKVPPEAYELADFNIAIGNQPHSEVAALAVFLHELFEGKELEKEFKDWEIKVEPAAKGKKIIKKK